jgi:hypothetical protein
MANGRSSYLGRERRISMQMDAILVEPDGCRVPVRMLDVSSSGFRIQSDSLLVTDEDVLLHIAESQPLRARICWTRQGEAGGVFLDPADNLD